MTVAPLGAGLRLTSRVDKRHPEGPLAYLCQYGSSITLDCTPGVDLAGSSGFADDVDKHSRRPRARR